MYLPELRVKRLVDSKTVTAAGTVNFPIHRENLLEEILIDIQGTAVTTDLVSGDIRDNAPAELVPRIEVQTGVDYRITKNLAGVLVQNRRDFQTVLQSCVATSTALCTFRSTVILPIVPPTAGRYGWEYLMDTRGYDTLNLNLSIAAPAQGEVLFVTGEPTTVPSFSVTIRVYTIEQIPGSKFAAGRPARERPITKRWAQREGILEVSAANSRLAYSLDLTGKLHRVDFLAVGGADVDHLYRLNTIINAVSLKHGNISFRSDVPMTSLQGENAVEYGWGSVVAGEGHIDFSPDCLETQMLDTRGMTRLDLLFDVNAPSTVDRIYIWPFYVQ